VQSVATEGDHGDLAGVECAPATVPKRARAAAEDRASRTPNAKDEAVAADRFGEVNGVAKPVRKVREAQGIPQFPERPHAQLTRSVRFVSCDHRREQLGREGEIEDKSLI
jgi:hypothetical protein